MRLCIKKIFTITSFLSCLCIFWHAIPTSLFISDFCFLLPHMCINTKELSEQFCLFFNQSVNQQTFAQKKVFIDMLKIYKTEVLQVYTCTREQVVKAFPVSESPLPRLQYRTTYYVL